MICSVTIRAEILIFSPLMTQTLSLPHVTVPRGTSLASNEQAFQAKYENPYDPQVSI